MIKELNVLRIIFMLMIFLNHSAFLVNGGYLGVACFFVLGGYCLTLGYHEKVMYESFNYSRYLFTRASKFYPLHWLCILVWLFFAMLSGNSFGRIFPALTNILLIQSWVPDSSYYFSLNGISWYLADTVSFTFAFPILSKHVLHKSWKVNLIFIFSVLLFYVLLCLLTPAEMRHAILYINPLSRFVDFIVGVYLACGFIKIQPYLYCRKPSAVSLPYYLVAGLCVLLLLLELRLCSEYVKFAWIFWPLIALLIFSSSIASVLRNKESRIIDFLSSAGSYCFVFYMIHQLTIQVCNSLAHKLHFEYHFLVMTITLVLCSILSYYCHKLFVAPVSSLLKKQIDKYFPLKN